MEQTILFGNGINRLSGKDFDWYNLLQHSGIIKESESLLDSTISICTGNPKSPCEQYNLIPLTHLFEDLMINYKSVVDNGNSEGLFTKEEAVKKIIIEIVNNLKINDFSKKIYEELINLDVANYLTTNYDSKFIDMLGLNKYYCKSKHSCHPILSTYENVVFANDDTDRYKTLWPIHGDSERVKSILLGYDHYCSSIHDIEKYIREGGQMKDLYNDFRNDPIKGKNRNKPNYAMYRLMHSKDSSKFESWVDAFFATDVHIIGLGMDLAENDLWWLLDKRIRSMKYGWSKDEEYRGIIKNKIYCYGYFPKHVYILLKAYGVNVDDATLKKPAGEDWYGMYRNNLEAIKKHIEDRKNV